MSKDWIGNSRTISATSGFATFSNHEREENDYYATEPKALELLLELESFNNVWEPAVGGGHLAEVLKEHNIYGQGSDLIYRDYEGTQLIDYLEFEGHWDGDIITNPPYKFAQEFIEKSLDITDVGSKVAMFLPIRYLETKRRKKLFESLPPRKVYISSSRLKAAMNGDFEGVKSSAVAYAWFIWENGYKGATELKWFN